MEKMFDSPITIICIVVLAGIAIIFLLVLLIPRGKPCTNCGQRKTRNKDGICDICTNDALIKKEQEKPEWKCPVHGITMDIRIAEINTIIVHECGVPGCNILALHEQDLKSITIFEVDMYPPK